MMERHVCSTTWINIKKKDFFYRKPSSSQWGAATGAVCGANVGGEEYTQGFWTVNLKKRDHQEDRRRWEDNIKVGL